MPNTEAPTNSGLVAAPEDEDETEEEEYVVEQILSHRVTRKGKLEYYLKWKGFSDADNTWEPAENLNCKDLVEAYEAQRAKKEKKTSSKSKEDDDKKIKKKKNN